MSEKYLNCYQRARKNTQLSQERAAEKLYLSVESLKAYETGLRVPPNATVVAMAEIYQTPWLALEHLKNTSAPLGVLPEGITVQSLPTAAIRLINSVLDFAEQHRDRQLLRIAEDGVISEAERPAFENIVAELDEIIRAALQVKFVETKKDRSDAGTSKRSGFKTFVENDCTNSIPESGLIGKSIFAQEGGDSL
ncbi:MAG: helix-turn-helix domain-containing protein [Oscillibacter sp.]|nr:helix-turn-helix domain-containing protein [Oscillibacter sp.]